MGYNLKVIFFTAFLFFNFFTYAESSISVLSQIGKELDKIENKLVKGLLEKRVQKAWSLDDESEKISALKAIFVELTKNKGKEENSAKEIIAEIELCNYLIQQACILEALDGAGVKIVRDDLSGNLNDHGLSVNGKRLLRRLVQLCEEAEKSYQNVSYVEVDGSDAQAALLTENISTGVGISLAMGDVTPLIAAAVKIGRGYNNINKSKSRQLDLLIQAHKARINNFLFNVNSHKNDLIAENNVDKKMIITPDWYRDFLKALTVEKAEEKLKLLNELSESHPDFVTSKLYLSQIYFEMGNTTEAKKHAKFILKSPSRLLHKDGFSAQAHSLLGQIYEKNRNYEKAFHHYSESLKENPLNGFVYNWRAGLLIKINKPSEALADLKKSKEILPQNIDVAFNHFKASVMVNNSSELILLNDVFMLGFNDTLKISQWPFYKKFKNDQEVQRVLSPQFLVAYKPGIFKDDALIWNTGSYDLTELKYSLKIKFLKKELWETITVEGEIPVLKIGESYTVKDKFSMPKKSQCVFEFSFNCKQQPQSLTVKSYYNAFGNGHNLHEWEYLRDKVSDIKMFQNNKDILTKSVSDIEKALRLSFYSDTGTLAAAGKLYHKLGDLDRAEKYLNNALQSLKGQLSPEEFKISSQPYKELLKLIEKQSK